MHAANDEIAYKAAAEAFRKVRGYKDADAQAAHCLEKAETARKDEIYNRACDKQSKENFADAADLFRQISGFKDADAQAEKCAARAKKLAAEESKNAAYSKALDQATSGTAEALEKASTMMKQVGDYKDAKKLIAEWEKKLNEKTAYEAYKARYPELDKKDEYAEKLKAAEGYLEISNIGILLPLGFLIVGVAICMIGVIMAITTVQFGALFAFLPIGGIFIYIGLKPIRIKERIECKRKIKEYKQKLKEIEAIPPFEYKD